VDQFVEENMGDFATFFSQLRLKKPAEQDQAEAKGGVERWVTKMGRLKVDKR
jgi:hypothetical protein